MIFTLFTVSFALPTEQCNGADDVCLLQLKDAKIAKQDVAANVGNGHMLESTPELQDIVLLTHNQYRCMHGVQNLVWDEKIAEQAQELVKTGVFKHSTAASRMYVDEGGSSSRAAKYKGENLWMCTKQHTMEEAVQFAVNSWYSEIEFTDEGLVGADGQGNEGIVAHYTQLVWAKTTRVGCAVGKVGRDWDRGDGTFVVCQYGPGGNFENGYPQFVNGPVRNFDECLDKDILKGERTKRQLIPRKVKKCRKEVKKECTKEKKECIAEMNLKCKVEGIKIHEPELSHNPNSADYCPCCMDYYQMKSGNLFEEDEEEIDSCDKEATDKFEAAQNCCGGMDGHQKLGFMTPGMGSTRFFKR